MSWERRVKNMDKARKVENDDKRIIERGNLNPLRSPLGILRCKREHGISRIAVYWGENEQFREESEAIYCQFG